MKPIKEVGACASRADHAAHLTKRGTKVCPGHGPRLYHAVENCGITESHALHAMDHQTYCDGGAVDRRELPCGNADYHAPHDYHQYSKHTTATMLLTCPGRHVVEIYVDEQERQFALRHPDGTVEALHDCGEVEAQSLVAAQRTPGYTLLSRYVSPWEEV